MQASLSGGFAGILGRDRRRKHGVADVTRRIAQEMVANDGVNILAGFGLTPLALAVAPISAQARVPQIVMMSATSIVTDR